jgi:hypothetical protein
MHPLHPPPPSRAPHARFSCNYSHTCQLHTRFCLHRRRLSFVLTPSFSASCPSHFRRITRINVAIGKRLRVLRSSAFIYLKFCVHVLVFWKRHLTLILQPKIRWGSWTRGCRSR